jgi:hypothetical protein
MSRERLKGETIKLSGENIFYVLPGRLYEIKVRLIWANSSNSIVAEMLRFVRVR